MHALQATVAHVHPLEPVASASLRASAAAACWSPAGRMSAVFSDCDTVEAKAIMVIYGRLVAEKTNSTIRLSRLKWCRARIVIWIL